MKYKITRKILIFLCLFVGICALFGSTCLIIDPSGKLLRMNELLPYFEVLPLSNILFNNYIFAGFSLLLIIGIPNLIVSYLIIINNKKGIVFGAVVGIILMLWILIQFIILPHNILSTTYFLIGVLQFIIGYIAYVFYAQDQFEFNTKNYKNINKNKNNLVIYFSRMGYTKKIAYEKANELGAFIVEIKTEEKVKGVLGFWWCGRYGLHKWGMPISKLKLNIMDYKHIIIVSPIWVFSVCSPIRMFCALYKNDINSVEYVFTHFMKCKFINVANEIDNILGIKRSKFTTMCIRFGKLIKVNEID